MRQCCCKPLSTGLRVCDVETFVLEKAKLMKSPRSMKLTLWWAACGGWGAADGQRRPLLVTFCPLGLFSSCDSIHLRRRDREGTAPVQLTAVENRSIQLPWHHISFHSALNNCELSSGLVLCLRLVVTAWSWTESLRVTFVFSFTEDVLQLLTALEKKNQSVSELVRC